MNKKKGTGRTVNSSTNHTCPKCNSVVSTDSFEPTCVICGWVDYTSSEIKSRNKKLKVNLRNLNKAS